MKKQLTTKWGIAAILVMTLATMSLTAAERAPKGVEKAKQIQKYDTDGDAKLDAKEKGKVQADKTKLLKEVRPQREAELTPAQREAEKAKLLEKKSQ